MQTKKLRASAVAWLLLMPLFIGLLFIGGTNAGVTPALDETSWTKGTIDGQSDVSKIVSQTIDLDGNLHVCYYNAAIGGQELMYATNKGGVWVTDVVDDSGVVGTSSSIAVDKDGVVHISYFDHTNSRLKYAKGSVDHWQISVVGSQSGIGKLNSIVVDSNDKVHIFYLDELNDQLGYATNAGGSWSYDYIVDYQVSALGSTISSGDVLNVAYIGQDGKLNYAYKNGNDWTIEEVSTAVTYNNGLDIDIQDGQVYIAYTGASSALKMSVRSVNGVWVDQTVDSDSGPVSWVSLDVSSFGEVHIIYSVFPKLMYAVLNTDWNYYVLDSSIADIHQTIVSDNNDKQHVIYIDIIGTTARLGYITNSGANWQQVTVASATDEELATGEQSSIAVDEEGYVHIAYYDNPTGSLMYANNVAGWNYEVVDNSTSMVGLSPSIALDSDGHVHISYYDMTGTRNLKYANNVLGEWRIILRDSGDVGSMSSIVVDGAGKIHIAYLDDGNGNLKYTTNAFGSWTQDQVDNSTNIVGSIAMKADSQNNMYIAYFNEGSLNLIESVGSGWQTPETVDSTGGNGRALSMFIDDQDHIYLTYYNEALRLLKYINNVSGMWSTPEIIEADGAGSTNAITVDDNNNEHIAYLDDDGNGVLKYIEKRDGIWLSQKVDVLGCAYQISMALDEQGRSHICYFDPVSKDLKYVSSVAVPRSPTDLGIDIGDGNLVINWTEPKNDGGSSIIEYRIFRANATDGVFHLYATVSASSTTYYDMDLENGVALLYKITAVNSEGSSPYSEQVAGTPCTLPGAPIVSASGRDKSISLDWDEPSNGGAAIEEYNIYRKNETGMCLLIGTVDGTMTKYTDTGLENGVEYSYQVTAVNPAGEGPASETASATANPSNDMMIIIVVIVLLAAAGAGIFFLMRRGRI